MSVANPNGPSVPDQRCSLQVISFISRPHLIVKLPALISFSQEMVSDFHLGVSVFSIFFHTDFEAQKTHIVYPRRPSWNLTSGSSNSKFGFLSLVVLSSFWFLPVPKIWATFSVNLGLGFAWSLSNSTYIFLRWSGLGVRLWKQWFKIIMTTGAQRPK